MGVGADFSLVGRDIIRFLLGPGWEEAGRIFVLFGPGIGVMLLYYTHGWVHLSIGRPERWFRWGLMEFVCTATLFLLALRWGPFRSHLPGLFRFSFSCFLVSGTPETDRARRSVRFSLLIWKFFAASVVAERRDCSDQSRSATFCDGGRSTGCVRENGFSFSGVP